MNVLLVLIIGTVLVLVYKEAVKVYKKINKAIFFGEKYSSYMKSENFEQLDNLYRGVIKDFRVDIIYLDPKDIQIFVRHEKVKRGGKNKMADTDLTQRFDFPKPYYIYDSFFHSVDYINFKIYASPKETIMEPAMRFINTLIENGVEPEER